MPIVSTLGAASSRGFGEFNQQAAGAYIEDYFSTYLYSGTGVSQTITNNIGLASTAAWSTYKLPSVQGNGCTTDSSGNIYTVCGYDGYLTIVKYNSLGVVQWQRKLNNGTSVGYGVTVDSSGNVIVIGNSQPGNTYILLAKYDSSGSLQWQRELYQNSSIGYSVATDSSGNIYLTGVANDGTNNYIIIAKYNSSGTIQWQRKVTKTASSDSYGFGISVDSSSNVYVTGKLYDGTSQFAFIAKYNTSGTIQWQRSFKNSNAYGVGITVDSSSNVYVVGSTNGNSSAFIAKYDSSGVIQWQRKLTQGNSSANGVSVDSSGNAYISGTANDGTAYTFVAKYNSSGTIQWQVKLRQIVSQGTGIRADSSGNLYVVGYDYDGSQYYAFTTKLNTDGTATSGAAFLTLSAGTLTEAVGNSTDSAGSATDSAASATDSAGSATDSAGSLTSTTATQTAVVNGGGLVWIKGRSTTSDHALYDTARGATFDLASNTSAAQTTQTTGLTSFNANGFSIGSLAKINTNGAIYASWTFAKKSKFFDVVTYTGDGSTDRTINHSLDSTPAMIFVKCTSENTRNWMVYHRGLNGGGAFAYEYALSLNAINGEFVSSVWKRQPTSTSFFVTSEPEVNGNGKSYVAYLFAHDAGGFGADGSQNVISCGSYTGTVNDFESVNLGYEPQCLLIKKVNTTGNWFLIDNMRGFNVFNTGTGSARYLYPNLTNVETGVDGARVNSTGFSFYFGSGETYIYMAIRRGPMATPTDATKVFMPTVYTGTNVDNRLVNTTIAPDTVWIRQRNSTTVGGMVVGDRLRGQPYLLTGTTAAEVNDADSFDQQLVSAVEYGTAFSSMDGVWVGNDATSQLNASTTASNQIIEAFKRAPGFHDVVSYQGTGSTQSIPHNLGVVPQMIIVKNRTAAPYEWAVYTEKLTATSCLFLNSNSAGYTDISIWNNTSPTSSVFTVKDMSETNQNGQTFSAYLFASCPKVSKVGFYTGTGTTNQIDCGFTSGARFVLIKRTGTTGSWYVYDSARGIVAGNDPYILTNSTAGEVTGTDYVDTYAAGFELSSTAPADLNANGGTYIFLAIA